MSKKIDTAHREKVQMPFNCFYCASTPASWYCHSFDLF